jgi:major vault protein
MSKELPNERDLVLAPTSFAYVLDKTQGEVVTYVGPVKVSLADSDQPVIFDYKTKKYRHVSLNEAIQNIIVAPEQWYIIMKNPALDSSNSGGFKKFDKGKNASNQSDLTVGRKVNIPGPTAFPLWPGQMAQVVQGHHLRSNQYLLVRVYDEDAARQFRDEAVIKAVSDNGNSDDSNSDDADNNNNNSNDVTQPEAKSLIPEDLTIGKQFIIRGTDASFFIPPTGIEIVRDENGEFIREAETLELLEYCILLDESGEKRFVRGPIVVFPEPTEVFVTKKGTRKFTAFELNDMSGLYIKATKDYVSKGPHHDGNEKDTEVITGAELFVTGKTTPVYFPCEEHAIIQYGQNKKINYAVAIPSGTARYVLNRKSGEITTLKGPAMFLPDPRTQVMIRRILSDKDVRLMYPGNEDALTVNAELNALRVGDSRYAVVQSAGVAGSMDAGARLLEGSDHASGPLTRSQKKKAMKDFAGDQMVRGTGYTPPRTLTLDNKFDGVVCVDIWTGYAVNVVSKNGDRKVVEGPTTVMLDYDESLEPFYLSRGTPKTNDRRKEDVYLRVSNNRVTDIVRTQTKDLVGVSLTLSYRVNFEGNPNKWFNVDNYVALLTDHLRSLLRNEVQKHGVKEFWENKIDVLRDCILGVQGEDTPRPGKLFEQNGMRVYDIDFIDARIEDAEMAAALVEAQHETIRSDLMLEHNRRQLETYKENENLKRERTVEGEATNKLTAETRLAAINRESEISLRDIELSREAADQRLENKLGQQELLDQIQKAEIARQEADADLKDRISKASLALRLEELQAQAKAEIDRVTAVSPDLIAAMQSLGHSELVKALTSSLSPLAMLGGTSVADVGRKLLTGTGLEDIIEKLPDVPISKRNGKGDKGARPLPR